MAPTTRAPRFDPDAGAELSRLRPVFEEIRLSEGVDADVPQAARIEALEADTESDPGHIVDPRGDATDLALVTVDPPGSRDLDQAFLIERLTHGHRLRYAIADVGAHVRPGGALDALAHARGATVYAPDARIGLHPAAMSEGHASLLPDQRTKAVLWTLDLDADGALADVAVERVWVRSRRQFTYRGLASAEDAETRALRKGLSEVGGLRAAAVRRAGGVTLPIPDQHVARRNGRLYLEMEAGSALEDHNAHLSLATGMAAARLMLDGGVGVLRTMPPAEDVALAGLRREALALGVSWPADASYGDVLASLDPRAPESAAFLVAATRLFRGAAWEAFDVEHADMPIPDQRAHGALGSPYAHVTAPLRRLVDRYATEACLAQAAGRELAPWARDGLTRAAEDTATGMRRAAAVDRSCTDAVEGAVLADRVGSTFWGVGLDDRTVQLTRPAVIARATGDVSVGERQRFRLTEADPRTGTRFEALRN